MDWKGLAIGLGQSVGHALPQMERLDMAEEEIGMRKDTHNIQMAKYKEEQDLKKGLEGIALKYLGQAKTIAPAPPGGIARGATPATATPKVDEAAFQQWYSGMATKQGLDPNPDNPMHQYDYRAAYAAGAAPDATGHWPSEYKMEGHPNLIVNGVNTKTGQPVIHEATVSGAPNVDSGSGIEVGSKANTVGQPAPQATALPGENKLPALNLRSGMLMEMHDFLMSKGRIAEAKQLRKAEMDNIVNIAKISPKAAIQGWNNTPWLVEEYGPLGPNDIKGDGKSHVLTFGPNHDGIIRWSDNGQVEVVKPSSGKTEKLTQAGSTPDGKPVSYDSTIGGYLVDGKPYAGRVLPKVEKVVKEGGDEKKERQEFRKEIAGLDGLYKSKASIQKGVDPLTGQIIPQDNITASLATIDGQIQSKEAWISSEYPDHWKTYRKPQEPKGVIGGGGKPAPKGRKEDIGYLVGYFKENGTKFDSKKLYDTLLKQGYSEEAIKEAWKQYRSPNTTQG